MLPWSVHAYIHLLFALELLLFVASVSLHGTVFFIGATECSVQYSEILFRAQVVIGMLVFAFVENGLRWVQQIKSCPTWMWKGSLIAGIYAILIAVFAPTTVTLSGFPIAFEAISICVLYSVISKSYLEESELVRRSPYSVVMAALIGTVLLSYRAGYLHPPGR